MSPADHPSLHMSALGKHNKGSSSWRILCGHAFWQAWTTMRMVEQVQIWRMLMEGWQEECVGSLCGTVGHLEQLPKTVNRYWLELFLSNQRRGRGWKGMGLVVSAHAKSWGPSWARSSRTDQWRLVPATSLAWILVDLLQLLGLYPFHKETSCTQKIFPGNAE